MTVRTDRPAPRAFAALLHGWFAAGLLGSVLPLGHWPAYYVGPSAWWGLGAPAICLLLLHRRRLAAVSLAWLGRARRRRHLSRRIGQRGPALGPATP
jgi:hypothetical protein